MLRLASLSASSSDAGRDRLFHDLLVRRRSTLHDRTVRRTLAAIKWAFLAGCVLVGSSGFSSTGNTAAAAAGQFVPTCNGGRGIQLHPADVADLQSGYVAALSGGDVVFGYSYTPSTAVSHAPPVVLEAVRPNCTIDTQFGVDGVLHLRWPGNFLSSVDAIAPTTSGGALIFGGSGGRLIATEIDDVGQIVRSFGRNGWLIRKLPDWSPETDFSPYTASLLQESNGNILMGSSNGCAHACTVPRVYAFSRTGQLRWTYAPKSTSTSLVLPMGSEIDQLIPLADGTVVIVAPLDFGGCGSLELAALNPQGRFEPSVTSSLQRGVEALRSNSYNDGRAYQDDAGGVGIFGALNRPCSQSRGHRFLSENFLERTARDGHLISPPTYLDVSHQSVFNDELGTDLPGGDLIIWDPNASGSVITLRGLRSNGTPIAGFGHRGTIDIRQCSYDSFASGCIFGSSIFTAGVAGDFDVVASDPLGPRLLELTG
jgi:hypothetical protein